MTDEIVWREWSKEAFEDAERSGKLVLLDLSASWCHWCHVMDSTSYSDPDIIRSVNSEFIPVRVDIDKRPDISERYNRGGFPTTAFLSDRGETIWGGTYVPPDDMKEIIKTVLDSKASGEVAGLLERQRQQFLDISLSLERREAVDSAFVAKTFDDIFSSFDPEWGGFGIQPKFPHPDVIDLLLYWYGQTGERELEDEVRSTLDHMTDGLYDETEGGFFRYSVTRNWKEPHYEKMLETNLGFLRNLAHAGILLGEKAYADTAKGVADYILKTLRDASGGFFSSQDADEEYYKLAAKERSSRTPPKVIKEIFSGWNLQGASTFIEAGALLENKEWIRSGMSALTYSRSVHWNQEAGLVRHQSGKDLYLFEDQVSFLEALLAAAEVSPREQIPDLLELGKVCVVGVGRAFTHAEGGFSDIMATEGAIGELAEPKRVLQTNARWARAVALLGAIALDPDMSESPWKILRSFPPKQVQAAGVFAASYILAWRTLELLPKLVEIHGVTDGEILTAPLWLEAKRALNPSTLVTAARPMELEVESRPKPFAVICSIKGCSKEIEDPKDLLSILRPSKPGEV